MSADKSIVVDEATWERLSKLKLETRAKSIDEVISNLLKEHKA